jgi:MFS family permease
MFTLCFGRFLHGVGGGVMAVVSSLSINETIPAKYLGSFGSMTAFYLVFGILLVSIFGSVLPDPSEYEKDDNWRIIYGMPAIIALL